MSFFLIGAVVGLALGFTGSGGTLIALPLFLALLGLEVPAATTYALVVVVLAATVNLLPQLKAVDYRVALPLLPLSAVLSYFVAPLKILTPAWLVVGMILIVTVFSLLTLWQVLRFSAHGKVPAGKRFFTTLVFGLVLGALATLTGLGGGVLLLPVLVGVYHLEQKQAVATSLFTICVSSLLSLALQAREGIGLPGGLEFLFLSAGVIVAFVGLTRLAPFNPKHQRWAYTAIVVGSLARLIYSVG